VINFLRTTMNFSSNDIISALLLLFIFLFVYIAFNFTKWRNNWIKSKPFPKKWDSLLAVNLPIYSSLNTEEKRRLQKLIQLFITKKRFVGCAGLTITDNMKVTIAAEACLLLLNHPKTAVYPKLYSVLVYPGAFRTEREQQQSDGTVSIASHNLSGESWSNGKVVLSWDDVVAGASDFTDGQNVVLHEFAHQLDSHSGSTNGAPPLRRKTYGTWSKVLSEEFEDLQKACFRRHKTVMDHYGATNPAEFFAVATEAFFEKPKQLYLKHQELYEELRLYYQADPRQWHQ
jgi:Mlc titration factor MtfA (ptsG expression regulator)